jgi:lipopolysaccharide/colanic/teichoic acid biosynthesis glycosyltransferase
MGDRCEIKNPQQFYTSTATTTAIILPILLLLIILIVVVAVFMYRRRAAGNQFKHQRMGVDGSNMEISNPIYMKDYDDEEADGFSFDGDKPTNFSNPMYDTLYNENATDLQPDSEKKQLLKTKNSKLTFYGEEEPPDTSFA